MCANHSSLRPRLCAACQSAEATILGDHLEHLCARCWMQARGVCPDCGHPQDVCECEGGEDAPAAPWHAASDREGQP